MENNNDLEHYKRMKELISSSSYDLSFDVSRLSTVSSKNTGFKNPKEHSLFTNLSKEWFANVSLSFI